MSKLDLDALEETFYIDFFNSDFMPFFSRAEAEKFLAENIS